MLFVELSKCFCKKMQTVKLLSDGFNFIYNNGTEWVQINEGMSSDIRLGCSDILLKLSKQWGVL